MSYLYLLMWLCPFASRSKYVRGDFSAGKSMLKENTGDILLVPIVVTTTDVQDFDFSIPIFKTWYVTVNAVHSVYCRYVLYLVAGTYKVVYLCAVRFIIIAVAVQRELSSIRKLI